MNTAFHVDAHYTAHVPPAAHPERPERIHRLLSLAEDAAELGVSVFPSTRRATDEELARVHTPSHIETVASTGGRDLVKLDPDTFTSADSHDIARHAAGSLLDLVDAVLDRQYHNGFAAVRPPGHHAEPDRAMGFCLFNNIAIAARHLTERRGQERVLIVDWDVHHGNGTQRAFYRDPRVLFVSVHRWPFYPGTGAIDETGAGEGAGHTVNIPIPYGCGDADFLAALDRVIIPIARRFEPQFVLVSAGFDAHALDPLGGMDVTEDGYARMARRVLSLADEFASGRCVAVLEGGYHIDALSLSVEAVLRTMASFEGPGPLEDVEAAAIAPILDRVLDIHRGRWGI